MRRIILTVSLAALFLNLCPATAQGLVVARPTLSITVEVTADGRNEPPDIVLQHGAGNWLWDLLMDRLTIPLGPADQKTWPLWAGHEQ
jgi:hypothetical protein